MRKVSPTPGYVFRASLEQYGLEVDNGEYYSSMYTIILDLFQRINKLEKRITQMETPTCTSTDDA